MTLLICDEDVKDILTYEETIDAVEESYRQYGLGQAGVEALIWGNPPPFRSEMRVFGKNLPHLSPEIRSVNQSVAYLEKTGMVFIRWSFHLGNRRGNMSYLIAARTGEILAIIKAPSIMRMRVGSIGAVGVKYLANKNSRIVGVIGTGKVGKAQIEAISNVMNIEAIHAHSGRRKDQKFASEIEKRLGIDVISSDRIEDVVRKADILVTSTNSTKPIIHGEYVDEGIHINAVGADCPQKIELDHSTLKKADKIIIDSEQSLHTAELKIPIEKGIITLENIYGNIGEIVAGVKPGRESSKEITIFKNMGMTIPYVTINTLIYEKAMEMNLGSKIDKRLIDIIYS